MELKLHQMNKTILSKQLLIECLDHYHNVKENDYVVKPSLPIVFFGDINSYNNQNLKIVTVGKNPSNREFQLNKELYSYVRFPDFKNDIDSLELSLNNYFKHKPYSRWFNSYEPFLNGMESSYYPKNSLNKVIHTDICSPISTNPTWSLLTKNQQNFLFEIGFKIWKKLISEIKPNLIILSIPKEYVYRLNSKKLETIYTIRHTKEGKLRKKPFELELYSVEINGFNTLLVYGESKNTPLGSVSTEDKIKMGKICLELIQKK